MAKVTDLYVGLESGNLTTAFATWSFSKPSKEIEGYRVYWYYYTNNEIWFNSGYTDVTVKQATFAIPSNAKRVKISVKPISTKYTSNKKEKSYWTGEYVTKILYLSHTKPPTPSAPRVEVKDFKLTATLDITNDDRNDYVQFYLVKGNTKIGVSDHKWISETGNRASHTFNVSAGATYRVKCRIVNYEKNSSGKYAPLYYSDWSEFSAEVNTKPGIVSDVKLKGLSDTSVQVSWSSGAAAKSYEIIYTDNKSYFNSNPEGIQTKTSNTTHAEITGLESGKKWYFRVRSLNDNGESEWRPTWDYIPSIRLGSKPAPPTTWTFSSTAALGDRVPLYWIHNTEDSSNQYAAYIVVSSLTTKKTYDIRMGSSSSRTLVDSSYPLYSYAVSVKAGSFDYETGNSIIVDFSYSKAQKDQCYLKIGDDNRVFITNWKDYSWKANSRVTFTYIKETERFRIEHVTDAPDETEPDGTFVYNLDTSVFKDGDEIKWSVQTRGIVYQDSNGNSLWSDSSTQRSIKLYTPPSLSLILDDNDSADGLDNTLEILPYNIHANASSSTQKPVNWFVEVVSRETYTSEDNIGRETLITEGTVMLSKVISSTESDLIVPLLPDNISLENNRSYDVNVKVTMNSGLSAEASDYFTVSWADETYEPSAAIDIDDDRLTAVITPACYDYTEDESTGEVTETLTENVTLSVYRMEYDGTFTLVDNDIPNDGVSTVFDPHPSLDYARYRIVATSTNTGNIGYSDIPGEYVGGKSIAISYNEYWNLYTEQEEEDEFDIQPSSGVLIKLPYNVNVSEQSNPDVSLIEYLGREHPVSYYGTQRGITASWTTDIDKENTDMIYELRRLATWRGDVYVREPSGVGYWAHVTVSMNINHNSLTIPVTFNISRVEGGL